MNRIVRCFFDPSFDNSFLFLNLDELQAEDTKVLIFRFIDSVFQTQLVSRGECAPCHCALVEIDGHGVVIGGAGESGKTTCANRLPKPHRSLADDYAMIFEHQGRVLAQAMPTWSNLYFGDLDYRADCTQITEVEAFFFLNQSRTDHIEIVNGIEAISYLNELLQDLLSVNVINDIPETIKTGLRIQVFDFAIRLAAQKPTAILHASLKGEFWSPLRKILPVKG